MLRLPRFVGWGLALLGALAAVSIGVSIWAASWIPTRGKALLEAELERRLPVAVTIGQLSYAPWRGIILERVSAVDRADPSLIWFRSEHIRARVGLLRALLSRQVPLRIDGEVTAPCQTALTLTGQYALSTKLLRVTLTSGEIGRDQLIPQLASRLPPALTGGRVRLAISLHSQPGAQPDLRGRIIGSGVVWEQRSLRAVADVTASGRAVRSAGGEPWQYELELDVERGSVEGLPAVSQVTEISGRLALSNAGLVITRLQGRSAGSPWRLEGRIDRRPEPALELALRAEPDLATLAAAMPEQLGRWQPAGRAELLVVCRGPLARWPELEILAQASVRDAAIALPGGRSPGRVERIDATLRYDHLARRVTIQDARGRLANAALSLEGDVTLRDRAGWDLLAEATTPDLAELSSLLPPDHAVVALGGPARVRVRLTGTREDPAWQGSAALQGARVALRGLAVPLEAVTGTVEVTEQSVSSTGLRLVVNQQPAVIDISLTQLRGTPRLAGRMQAGDAGLSVQATLRREVIVLDAAELLVRESSLRVSGQIQRDAALEAALAVSGTIRPPDLLALPWLRLTAVEAWQIDGRLMTRLRVSGPLTQMRALRVEGMVRADTLSVKGVALRAVSAELDRRDGRLALRVSDAQLADGRLSGEAALDQAQEPWRYLVEFDLTRADLAQISAAVPAWREKPIQGAVSARARLTGEWTRLESLGGDGWLHATGEHLGELPLLKRLFRGLFGAVADRLGLSTLRSAQITEIGGQWRLAQARVWTDDLRLRGVSGAQPISLYVQGSVGLDKTLDLTVEPELTEQTLLESPDSPVRTVMKVVGGFERIRRLIARHHIGGTIDNPKYEFKYGLDQLLGQVTFGVGDLLDSLR